MDVFDYLSLLMLFMILTSSQNLATSKSIHLNHFDHGQSGSAFTWQSYGNRFQYKTRNIFNPSPFHINTRSYPYEINRKADCHRSYRTEHEFQSHMYHNQLAQQFQKAGGILYKKSILTPMEFKIIEDELLSSLSSSSTKSIKTKKINKKKNTKQPLKITLNKETSSSVANNRMGAALPWDSQTVKMLQNPNGSISQLVNQVMTDSVNQNAPKMILAQCVPVEVRKNVRNNLGAIMKSLHSFHKPFVFYSFEFEDTSL